MRILFWLFGVTSTANGLWMLAAPARWYTDLPAGVPDTGPLNLHFVRDIGAAFLTFGVMFLATASRAERHRHVVLAAGLFYVLHASIHVWDLLAGRLGSDHWLVDLPGVFLPALILVGMALPRWWSEPAGAASR
jgi:hypothetical protein